MKKIIALAVAGAFVAPAFAADITLSGSSEFSHVEKQTTTTTVTDAQTDMMFAIGFSTETANGIAVSGTIAMDADGTHDGGNNITLSSAGFGKLVLGDASGAMDSIDGATDGYYVVDHDATTGSVQGFHDTSVAWTLPTLAEGVTVMLSYSPKNQATTSGAASLSEGQTADVAGVMVGFSMAGLGVKVASEEEGTDKNQGVTMTYAINGVSLAYESHQNEIADGTKTNYKGYGVDYTMGDLTLQYSNVEEKQSGGSAIADTTAFGVSYSLGGGVTVFAENSSDDVISTKPDTTAVGITVSF